MGLQSRLRRTETAISRGLARVSAGSRLALDSTHLVDLSIATRLDRDIRSITQAVRSTNQGYSALAVADAAMGELTRVLQTIRDFAIQAANDTLSSTERDAIHQEVNSLVAEYDRIVRSTEFGGHSLLDGTFQGVAVGTDRLGGTVKADIANLHRVEVLERFVGTGEFTEGSTFSNASNPYEIAFGDLNNDGTLDMVAADYDNNELRVYFGNGDGTFSEGLTLAQTTPGFIEIADVTNDDVLDIVSSRYAGKYVQIFEGNGDGSFKDGNQISTGTKTYEFALGDLDEDGDLDLVTVPKVPSPFPNQTETALSPP